MKILLFAPNAGVSLSTGGGSTFTETLARTLLELGHEVDVAAYHALAPSRLPNADAWAALYAHPRFALRCQEAGALPYTAFRIFPAKLSAYVGLLLPGFDGWVRRTIRAAHPDLLWFQDDIPRAALPSLRSVRSSLYVHYPLAARSPRIAPALSETAPLTERVGEAVVGRVLGKVVADPPRWTQAIWANSSVTARAVTAAWGGAPVPVVPAVIDPVGNPPEPVDRTAQSVAVGTISRGKGYHVLVPWFAQATRGEARARLIIAGFSGDPSYLRRLRRAIRAAEADERTTLLSDVPGERLVELYRGSRTILHAAAFEPFGMVVLEAMARGCIPVVLRSAFSGAWVDLLEEGRWGFGFGTPEELGEVLHRLEDEPAYAQNESLRAVARAASFDRPRFVARVRELLNGLST